MFDYDGLEESNIEGKVIIGKCETIYAVGDRKPQRYGKTDTDCQKIRIPLDSGSTVDVMPSDELCQVEAVPSNRSRANRKWHKGRAAGREGVQGCHGQGLPAELQFYLGRSQKDLEVDGNHM